jgi:hypothetical protein
MNVPRKRERTEQRSSLGFVGSPADPEAIENNSPGGTNMAVCSLY